MKTLLICIVCFIGFSVIAQAPPLLRNDFTTNENPMARVVVTNIANAAASAAESGSSNTLYTGDQSLYLPSLGKKQLVLGTGPTKVAVIADTSVYYGYLANRFIQSIGSNGYHVPYGNVYGYITDGTVRNPIDGASVYTNGPFTYVEMAANKWYISTNNVGPFVGTYGNVVSLDALQVPGGGTLNVWTKTNGGTVAFLGSVNTAGTLSMVCTQWSVLAGYYQVLLSNTVGPTLLVGPGQWDTNSHGFCGMGATSSGGLDSDYFALYNTAGTKKFFTNANPAITFYTEISTHYSYLTNAQAIVSIITNTWNNSRPFVFSGGWPLGGDIGTTQQVVIRQYIALSNSIPWIDPFARWRNYTAMTNECGVGDGTHLTTVGDQIWAEYVWKALSLDTALKAGDIERTNNGAGASLWRANTFLASQFMVGDLDLSGPGNTYVGHDRNAAYSGTAAEKFGIFRNSRVLSIYDYAYGGALITLFGGDGAHGTVLLPGGSVGRLSDATHRWTLGADTDAEAHSITNLSDVTTTYSLPTAIAALSNLVSAGFNSSVSVGGTLILTNPVNINFQGTANQVLIAGSSNNTRVTVTFTTPQDINTSSSVAFASVNSPIITNTITYLDSSGTNYATLSNGFYNVFLGSLRYTINRTNGNVGIGTNAPAQALDNIGNFLNHGTFTNTGIGSISDVVFGGPNGELLLRGGGINITDSGSQGNISGSHTLAFTTTGNVLFQNSGNVGIGTTAPTAKLDVTAATATATIATHQTNAPVTFSTTGYTNTTGGNVFVSIIGTALTVTKFETNGTSLFGYGAITGTLPAIPLKPFQFITTSGTLSSNNVEPW